MLQLLKETWVEIAFLLGISGGFWFTLEPPVGNLSGALYGFVGAITLAFALGVRVTLGNGSNQPSVRVINWMSVLAFVFMLAAILIFLVYVDDRSSLVFEYKTESETLELVRGTEYQPSIQDIKKSENMTDIDLLNASGGVNARDVLWTNSSIQAAEYRLTIGYFLSLLFTLLSTILFIEILRVRRGQTA